MRRYRDRLDFVAWPWWWRVRYRADRFVTIALGGGVVTEKGHPYRGDVLARRIDAYLSKVYGDAVDR